MVRPWDSLSEDEKKLFCRMAEVYAGFLCHADHQIGRLLDYLEETGQLDNTIIVLVSDNGASGEGGPNGSVNENKFFNGIPDPIEENLKYLDVLGSPATYNHYPTGWAWAFNTPFKMWKRYNFEGGIGGPWSSRGPRGSRRRARCATSTTTRPTSCRRSTTASASSCRRCQGLHADPARRVRASATRSRTPTRRRQKETGFFSMLGSRAIWHKGWKAVRSTRRSPDWGHFGERPLGALRHGTRTGRRCTDLAAQYPEKLQELSTSGSTQAGTFNGLPLDDRTPRSRS